MKTIEERADEYEEICGCYGCEFAQVKKAYIDGAQSEHEELTRWNSSMVPPEHSKEVLIKTQKGYQIAKYPNDYHGLGLGIDWWFIGSQPIDPSNILGWREIHE